MRHACKGRRLNRTTAHRIAMTRNLVQSLFQHGEVRTTLPKAKHARALAERMITLAIDGSLAARQRAIALLNDRSIIRPDNQSDYDRMSDAKRMKILRSRSGRRYRSSTTRPGVAFTAESVIHRLFSEIGPAMKRRNESRGCSGGYTRVIRLSDRRLGDAAPTAILQLVGEDDEARPKGSDRTERKRRARAKYLFYAGKPLPRQTRRTRRASQARDQAPAAESAAAATAETSEDQAAEKDQESSEA